MEKILVTGGAGFIGSHTCEALLNKGYSVICVDNFSYDKINEYNIENLKKNKNFCLCKVDITDFKNLKNIFKNHTINKIIHLAAKAGVRSSFKNPKLYYRTNVEGTLNLLNLAVEFDVEQFIFCSSSSIYGQNQKIPFSEEDETNNQISPYASTKKEAELLCKKFSETHNLNLTCLRLFNAYGPKIRQDMAIYKFTKSILEGKEIEVYGSTDSKRDYTFISDIVDGIILSLDKSFKFEIINLGCSDSIKLTNLIKIIEKETGKKAKIRIIENQPGDVDITFADISKAKRLLNYEPRIEIEEGIKTFVGSFLKEKI